MQILQRQRTLVQYTPQLMFINAELRRRIQLQQILLHILENHTSLPRPLDDLFELDDVGVAEAGGYFELLSDELFDVAAIVHHFYGHYLAREDVPSFVNFAEVATARFRQHLVLLHSLGYYKGNK